MDTLLPLTVVVPLLVAAALSACNPLLRARRRLLDSVAILTAVVTTGMLVVILLSTGASRRLYWFAGITPVRGIALGIDFAVDQLNAGLATLAGALMCAAMVFSWRYFERVATYYHTLMLVFLAGMIGFCLTGDIFDLFVWFELMGVAASALTAYRPEERGPIQGALAFAITNSVGAYLSLSGIALIYGRTGALNMAQIGQAIAGHRPDGLVAVAFVLILAGLLTKAAIVPFHFWLADAHAVAPTPVCVLFSGVMVELGLYGIARVYWSMFATGLGHQNAITNILLVFGVLTAAVGAVFCLRQRHLKRLLAFSTINHAGLFLIGIALLTPLGLAGAALYVLSHGLIKAGLFLCVGVVLHRLGSINETWLHGRARHLKVTGVVFTLAALGLADLPPFGLYLGAGAVGRSADTEHLHWITPVIMATSALVGAAVLRVAGGVFYGLGDPPSEDPHMRSEADEETSETDEAKNHTPLSMIGPPLMLVALALAVGLTPHLATFIERAATHFQDQPGYNAAVLGGTLGGPLPVAPPAPSAHPATTTATDLADGAFTAAISLTLALLWLYWRRLPFLRRTHQRPTSPRAGAFTHSIWGLQSGIVNDYITWMVLGLACLAGALTVAIR